MFSALVLATTMAGAQDHERRLNFAINLEPHLNWIHPDETHLETGAFRLGIGSGLRVDYRFERFYALSVGLNWNQTGGNLIYKEPLILDLTSGMDTLQAGTRVTYRLQYVEIPIALKFILPEIGYKTWFFETGVDPMFNLKAVINATDDNIEDEPFDQGVGGFNVAWHAGLGFKHSFGSNLGVQFELIYKNTFLDVTRENDIRTADNSRINQVGISIGIVF